MRSSASRRMALGILAVSFLGLAIPEAFAFSASFRWCSGSPAFSLRGVPKGTARLDFEMTDLQVPSYRHGGGRVAYSGQKSVPCGALGSYVGPSPLPPQVHTYEFEIKAIGADGSTLGTAKARRKFPE